MSFSQKKKDRFTLSSLNSYQPATIVMQCKGIVYKAFWKRTRKVGQREPTLQHVFWRGKPVIKAVAQKQESTDTKQRKEQSQKKCNRLKNFIRFSFRHLKITWSKFPEVIEVSIQMSIISPKYIQVSIVGNCTQKDLKKKLRNLFYFFKNEQKLQQILKIKALTLTKEWNSSCNMQNLPVNAAKCTGILP